ncbi:hypothetical protein ACTL6U_04240 [Rhodovibrionaceae bacterium A322]
MSDVSGGMRIPPAAGSPTGPSGTPGQVINPPPSALQLVSGDSLGGTVTGTDKSGHLLIKTELGQLALLTSAKLPTGTQVNLQIRQTGSELYVLIFPTHKKVKDQTLRPATHEAGAAKTGAASSQMASGQAQNTAGSGSTALRQDTTTLGQRLTATLQALPHKAGEGSQTISPVQARPAGAPAPVNSALSAYAPPAGVPGTAATSASGGLVAGSSLSLKVVNFTAPANTTAFTAPTQNNTQLPAPEKLPGNLMRFDGLVIGQNGQGRPLVQSPLGLLVLNLQSNLPVGSRLQLESEMAPPADKTTASVAPKDAIPTAAGKWGMMEEILTNLSSAGQTYAGQEILSKLPKADAKLTSSLLFFMTALKSGDLSSWFPPLSQAQLKAAGKDDLVQKAGREFGQLSQLSSDPAGPSDWRLFLLPFMGNNQLREIRFFMRHGGQGGDGQSPEEAGPEATRFVVDVDLTRLGSMQLDGLVRESRFDLVLRSRQDLPLLMRNDIGQIFETANEIAGFQGSVTFQTSDAWQQMKVPGEESGSGNVVV